MEEWDPEVYDAWYETPLGRLSDRLEKDLVFSMAGVQNGERALDDGCGTGIYSIELAKKGAIAIGADSSTGMLRCAGVKARHEGVRISFVRADALRLPFPDDLFDLILSVNMLCFVKEREYALLEMRRILRPGGRLVIGVLNSSSPWSVFRRIKGLLRETVYNRAEFISPSGLKLSLERAGLEVKEMRTCIFFLPLDFRPYLSLAMPFERFGRAAMPWTGAFLAALVTKRGDKRPIF